MTRAEIKAHAFRIAVLRGWKPPPDRERRIYAELQPQQVRYAAEEVTKYRNLGPRGVWDRRHQP